MSPCLILCGGLGTRLQSVMQGRQKVMADIDERPFLEILVGYLAAQGFRRFIFCAGFGADAVEEHFARNRPKGVTIMVSREEAPLGTAGAVKNAEGLISSDRFFVVNGDSFCPFSCSEMHDSHLARGAAASIALVSAEPTSDGGFVQLDEGSRIVGFREKSHAGSFSYLNAGTYLLERTILGRIPVGRKYSFETELFPELREEKLFGFDTRSRLYDIGTPERLALFRRACKEILA